MGEDPTKDAWTSVGDQMKDLGGAFKEHYESDDELLLLTARLLSDAARRDEAVTAYKKVLARNPRNARALQAMDSMHTQHTPHRLAPEQNTPDPLLP